MTEAATAPLPDIASLLPHRDRMLLLDRCVEIGDDYLLAEVRIREDSPFCENGGVEAWVGIEYMAQAVGAFAGHSWRLRGEAPKLGFLLGTRKQLCHRPRFAVGSLLRVKATREYQGSDGLAAFSCTIEDESGLAAEAGLSVYEPADAAAYLKQSQEA